MNGMTTNSIAESLVGLVASSVPARGEGRGASPRPVTEARDPAPKTEEPVGPSALEAVTQELNRDLSSSRGIRFQVSGDGQDLIIQIVDLESDEVIRSIPPERLLTFREHFAEIRGMLLDDRA